MSPAMFTGAIRNFNRSPTTWSRVITDRLPDDVLTELHSSDISLDRNINLNIQRQSIQWPLLFYCKTLTFYTVYLCPTCPCFHHSSSRVFRRLASPAQSVATRAMDQQLNDIFKLITLINFNKNSIQKPCEKQISLPSIYEIRLGSRSTAGHYYRPSYTCHPYRPVKSLAKADK